jgi:uncharacterized protein (TIGR02646 family)
MIRLKKIPKPKFLDSKKIRDAVKRNRALIAAGKKPEFPSFWNEPPVRKALDKRHYRGKCCYTERRRDIQLERDVEHFRPKGKVTGENHPGYWWLAYVWDNLLIACKVNNTVHKANNFPLLNGGIRVNDENGNLEDERPVLINPAVEDPSKFITFHWEQIGGRWFCKPVPTAIDIDHRGRDTIEIVGLNRTELMGDEERAENGKLLNNLAKYAQVAKVMMENLALNNADRKGYRQQFIKFKNDIKTETAPEKTYAGARRAFFADRDLADCNYNEE